MFDYPITNCSSNKFELDLLSKVDKTKIKSKNIYI